MASKNPTEIYTAYVSIPDHWDPTLLRFGSLTIKLTYKPLGGFRSIDLKKSRAPLLTLSITGSVRDKWGVETSGQCVEAIRNVWGHRPEIAELCDLWDRWNLNHMCMGTRRQSEALRGKKNRSKHDYYTWACNYLKRKGLLVDHGYKYGAEWLFEPIPATVVKRIKALAKEINPSS